MRKRISSYWLYLVKVVHINLSISPRGHVIVPHTSEVFEGYLFEEQSYWIFQVLCVFILPGLYTIET